MGDSFLSVGPLPEAVDGKDEVDSLQSGLGVEPVGQIRVGPGGIRQAPEDKAGDMAVDIEDHRDEGNGRHEPVEHGLASAFRFEATPSKVSPVASRTAFFPVSFSKRIRITSE